MWHNRSNCRLQSQHSTEALVLVSVSSSASNLAPANVLGESAEDAWRAWALSKTKSPPAVRDQSPLPSHRHWPDHSHVAAGGLAGWRASVCFLVWFPWSLLTLARALAAAAPAAPAAPMEPGAHSPGWSLLCSQEMCVLTLQPQSPAPCGSEGAPCCFSPLGLNLCGPCRVSGDSVTFSEDSPSIML